MACKVAAGVSHKLVGIVAVVVLGLACQNPAGQDPGPPTVRAIVGGSVAATCQWPTTVIVNPIGCSGTLVHRRAVITAKHCLQDPAGQPDPPTSIGIGETDANPAKTVAIARCYAHPSNDFGICALAEDVTDLPLVPVMAACEMPLLKKGAAVVEAGFGANTAAPNAIYGIKRWIAGTLDASATDTIDIHATVGTQDGEYFGDSGGPLYFRMPDSTWRVIGEDCCSDDIVSGSTDPRVSIYTSIPYHVAWAEQQTGLDLTPCHDSHGWVGGPTCNGFSTDPDRTGGTWSTLCQGQTLLLAPTCGATYDAGAGADGGSPIDADPEALDATSDARFADAMRTDSVLDAEPADAPGGNAEVGQPAGPDDASGTGSAADGSVGLVDAGGIPDDVATSGTGGIAGASTSGGTTGGTVTGSGGWAASGGQAGRVSSAGGAPAAGGNTTTLDGSGGTGGSHNGTAPHTASNSGCSCRMESAGPLRAPVTLLVLGLLVGGRLRRRVKQTIAGLVMPAE